MVGLVVIIVVTSGAVTFTGSGPKGRTPLGSDPSFSSSSMGRTPLGSAAYALSDS